MEVTTLAGWTGHAWSHPGGSGRTLADERRAGKRLRRPSCGWLERRARPAGRSSAAACLAEDVVALTFHLDYLLRLKRRLRSTNLLERSLEEVRLRTKSSGASPARRAV